MKGMRQKRKKARECPGFLFEACIVKDSRPAEGVIVRELDFHGDERGRLGGIFRSEQGCRAETGFEEALAGRLNRYIANRSWWENIISGKYKEYYRMQHRAENDIMKIVLTRDWRGHVQMP